MFGIIKLMHLYKIYRLYKNLYRIQKYEFKIDECNKTLKELNTIKTDILNGGCLEIKLAQWFISKSKSNTDYNSIYISKYFEDIFEQCPRHNLEDTFITYKEDFGHNMEEIIELNTLKCIASGSVGQVYKCKLLNPIYIIDTSHKNINNILNTHNLTIDYIINEIWLDENKIPQFLKSIVKKVEWVAIKVKHPNINEDIKYKIECFNILKLIQQNKQLKNLFGLHADFNDFISNILQQIDFTNEYYNCYKFKKNFAGNYLSEFPRVICSSYNILITEYIESKNLDNISEYLQLKTCLNFTCAISKMVLCDNFLHGDIHDGNWGVITYSDNDIKNEPKIIYYDYGICFSSHSLDFNKKLWQNFEDSNADNIVELSKEMIIGNYDENDVKLELDKILLHFRTHSLDIVNLVYRINNILEKYNCKLSSILLNLILILSMVDSTLKKHNIIGKQTDNCNNYHTELRKKALDLLAYCNSRHIYPDMSKYLHNKRIRTSKLDIDNTISAFDIISGLDLDLPE
jgi:predicted unusual protein kinase regulating ubiquinone biosynthesis (AarF/ABC1/UbiB family)